MAGEAEVTAAFIGAAVTAAGLLARDVLIPLIARMTNRAEARKAAAERYAQPLAIAAGALFYRLREIIDGKRHSFLLSAYRRRPFGTYKFTSTLYRLAALMGWIWAIKKEHSILLERNSKDQLALFRIFAEFERSLADGDDAEVWMVRQLAELWGMTTPDLGIASALGAELDDLVDAVAASGTERQSLAVLSAEKQLDLIESLLGRFREFGLAPMPSQETVLSAWDRVTEILEIRQAWIFRDWQDAIGESMMRTAIDTSSRLFDAVGYLTFFDLIQAENPWFRPLYRLFDELDPDSPREDFRKDQTLRIYVATSQILIKLASLRLNQRCVSPDLEALAREVVAQHP